jgi:hypothetical protein
MSKNRDPRAPTGHTDEQLEDIRRMPRIIQLKSERLRLRDEMRSLAGTVKAAAESFPELYQQHEEVCKELTRVRKALRSEAKKKKREEYYDTMPVIEVDKQIDQLLNNQNKDLSDMEDEDEDWNPPIPQYEFPERVRIVEAFYGPEAETLDNDLALTRRIQVTKDLTALCGLSGPNRQGKRFNWNSDDEAKQEHDLLSPEVVKCPIDVCIIYLGNRSGRRPRKYRRIDSLRRHLIGVHFSHMAKGATVNCTLHSYKIEGGFTDTRAFLHHAATVHDYDLKIRPCRLQRCRPPGSTNFPSMKDLQMEMTTDSASDSTTGSTADSTTDATMSGTQTPASSVDSDALLNIDPRLC